MEVSQFINDANFRRRIKNESAQRQHEKKVVSITRDLWILVSG